MYRLLLRVLPVVTIAVLALSAAPASAQPSSFSISSLTAQAPTASTAEPVRRLSIDEAVLLALGHNLGISTPRHARTRTGPSDPTARPADSRHRPRPVAIGVGPEPQCEFLAQRADATIDEFAFRRSPERRERPFRQRRRRQSASPLGRRLPGKLEQQPRYDHQPVLQFQPPASIGGQPELHAAAAPGLQNRSGSSTGPAQLEAARAL